MSRAKYQSLERNINGAAPVSCRYFTSVMVVNDSISAIVFPTKQLLFFSIFTSLYSEMSISSEISIGQLLYLVENLARPPR